MKKTIPILALLFTLMFSSCEVVGAIFKAGVWTGIVIVVAVIALIIFVVTRIGKK